MDIRTHYDPKPVPGRQFDWAAVDYDSYDGAPDAGPRAHCVGSGRTEAEAIADLKQQLEDLE